MRMQSQVSLRLKDLAEGSKRGEISAKVIELLLDGEVADWEELIFLLGTREENKIKQQLDFKIGSIDVDYTL